MRIMRVRDYRLLLLAVLVVVLWMAASHVLGREGTLAPATGVTALDTPSDEGNSITITWELSPDDDKVSQYVILRSSPGYGSFDPTKNEPAVPAGTTAPSCLVPGLTAGGKSTDRSDRRQGAPLPASTSACTGFRKPDGETSQRMAGCTISYPGTQSWSW